MTSQAGAARQEGGREARSKTKQDEAGRQAGRQTRVGDRR